MARALTVLCRMSVAGGCGSAICHFGSRLIAGNERILCPTSAGTWNRAVLLMAAAVIVLANAPAKAITFSTSSVPVTDQSARVGTGIFETASGAMNCVVTMSVAAACSIGSAHPLGHVKHLEGSGK